MRSNDVKCGHFPYKPSVWDIRAKKTKTSDSWNTLLEYKMANWVILFIFWVWNQPQMNVTGFFHTLQQCLMIIHETTMLKRGSREFVRMLSPSMLTKQQVFNQSLTTLAFNMGEFLYLWRWGLGFVRDAVQPVSVLTDQTTCK